MAGITLFWDDALAGTACFSWPSCDGEVCRKDETERNNGLLAVIRFPIIDMRPLAVDDAVRESVRMPPSWDANAFVRSFGSVKGRLSGSPEGTRESSYIDSPVIKMAPNSFKEISAQAHRASTEKLLKSGLNEERLKKRRPFIHTDINLCKIQRRLWRGVPNQYIVFDFDLNLHIKTRKNIWLPAVVRLLTETLNSPVYQPSDRKRRMPVKKAAFELAERLQRGTSTNPVEEKSVFSPDWTGIIVLESEFYLADINSRRYRTFDLGDIRLLKVDSTPLPLYILEPRDRHVENATDLKLRLRTLRVALLRMHSYCVFLAIVGRQATKFPMKYDLKGIVSGAVDGKSQKYTLITTLQTIGNYIDWLQSSPQTKELLSSYARVSNNDLIDLYNQVLTRIEMTDKQLAELYGKEPQVPNVVNIGDRATFCHANIGNTYHANGAISVQQNQMASSDEQSYLAALIPELQRLYDAIVEYQSTGGQPVEDTQLNVTKAIEAASKNDSKTVTKALKAAGIRALQVAEKIGVPLALEAIKSAMG